jgi:hypothetical protein
LKQTLSWMKMTNFWMISQRYQMFSTISL